MPTTRPRHFITETDELAAALDAAAVRWPDLTRPQLIVRLALTGDAQAHLERTTELARRSAAIAQHAGALTGCYGPDYLTRLRDDWPE